MAATKVLTFTETGAADSTAADLTTGSIFFVGTATVILRVAGFTILTDPNFLHKGDHVHLGYGLQSVRLTNPAIELDQVPPVDFVLLSHMHEDHFDRVVAEQLDKRTPIVTTHHAASKLRKLGFTQLYPLEKWESMAATKGSAALRITSMPGRHGPGPLTLMLPQVMGTMLEVQLPDQAPYRIYITGDTLPHDELSEIPRRYPGINLALMHLGGTRIFGITLTMNDKQGVQVLKLIAPKHAIPIHYDDYEVFKSPLEDFKQAVRAAGWEGRITYLDRGESYTFRMEG